MLFAKKYKTFEEMNKIYIMHFDAREAKMYLRTQMVMLSWDSYTVPEIGRILDIHPHTVRHWIKQYNKKRKNNIKTPQAYRALLLVKAAGNGIHFSLDKNGYGIMIKVFSWIL